MKDWIVDRFETLRHKGVRDRGFILVSTIMLFVLVSGTVYWMVSTTSRSTKSAVASTDFVQSGQFADLAIQDALYQLNEVRPATLPTEGAPREGGDANTGSWQWYADPLTLGDGGQRTVLHASGVFRGTMRKVQATAIAPRVGGFTVESDKSITYQVSPSTAFRHTIMGSSVTVRNGIGGADPFITGSIGLLGDTVSVAAADTSSKAAVNYFQYGPKAASSTLPGAVRAPANLALDPGFINANLARCGGAVLRPWKASDNGGVLTASGSTGVPGAAGNVGCYSTMDFDVPTVIQGSGSFNAYVSGNVTVRQNISGSSSSALNVYANGDVAFPTEEANGSSLTVANMFIYAPQGSCVTVSPGTADKFRSLAKSLDFSGSLACKTVKVAGTFRPGTTDDSRFVDGKGPILPAGDDIFDNEVWYLADYHQPSGSKAP